MTTLSSSPLPPHLSWVATLPAEAQDALLVELERAIGGRKLELYEAYPRQQEFHEAGATYRERLLMAGNRLGKTYSAGAEVSMHLTGRYPSWWRGRAFHKGIQGAGASETSLLTRDGMQRILFGMPVSPLGTGLVPADAIKEAIPSKFGPAHFYEMIRIRHGGGGDVQAGESIFYQRSYDQGRERIQAMDLAFFWLDEEPSDIGYYMEALTRTNLTLGPVFLTFTPLKGMSDVVMRFLIHKAPGTNVTRMGIGDALHIPPHVRDAIIASYPAHEREARVNGTPQLGEGRVFQVPEDVIVIDPVEIAPHWPRIAGIDFGFDHPTAGAWLAWDRDADIVYLYDVYRRSGAFAPEHASVFRGKGQWIPVSWPQDGDNETAAGPQLSKQYRDEGINMLPESSKMPIMSDRSGDNTQRSRVSVEAGVQMMLQRMLSGRFKIFRTCVPFLEEYRMYHRKKGLIVKINDDVISATRYAMMDLDKAKVQLAMKGLDPHRRSNWRA